jgi:hypothetical protein
MNKILLPVTLEEAKLIRRAIRQGNNFPTMTLGDHHKYERGIVTPVMKGWLDIKKMVDRLTTIIDASID